MSTAPSPAAPTCSREAAGVLVVDQDAIDRLNRVDEAITVRDLAGVQAGGRRRDGRDGQDHPVRGRSERALEAALRRRQAVHPRRAVQDRARSAWSRPLLPGLAAKVIDKTLRVTEERLAPAGASIVAERRVPHEQQAVARAIDEVLEAGAELVVVFGASAIVDRRDVIPAAVEATAGAIEHFGMPVDPGNCMLIGAGAGPAGARRAGLRALAEGKRLRLGADAAARRPAGDARGRHGLGVGGLLMEIVTRPQPRAEPRAGAGAAASPRVILAAGRSTRMGGPNKLLAEIGGTPAGAHRRRAGARLARRARSSS